ncbi:MAG: hypothetical protein H7A23_17805 [Leptospiraceae bacterium]|nr:hypothetical protein [Leptospiraceae bacterium]
MAVLSSIIIIILLITYIDAINFSFYLYLFKIPGIGTIKAFSRIIVVITIFFAFSTAYMICSIEKKFHRKIKYFISIAILCFIVCENFTSYSYSYNKAAHLKQIEDLKQKVLSKIKELKLGKNEVTFWSNNPYPLDAMLLSQDMNIPTTSGYSGHCPRGYSTLREGVINWYKGKVQEKETDKILILIEDDY